MAKMGEDARLAYLQQMVEGASKEELLLMLLDGAVRFANKAEAAFDVGKWDDVHNSLCRAQNIFLELMLTLDNEVEDVTIRLNDIYGFINSLLIKANIDHDREALDQALGLIIDVKSMWEQTIAKARGAEEEPVSPGHQKSVEEAPKSINVRG
jgi:flagellar protein FliS